jgi:hypothetical protein
MRSFLLYKNIPTIKFSMLDDGIFYEGELPGKDYDLAVCPSNEKQVILDVDVKNGKDGYSNIPMLIMLELQETFNYKTKSGGAHYYLNYSGNKVLLNTSTKFGLDLRIGANKATKNAGGYVRYNGNIPVKEIESLIKETSPKLNTWLEKLFTGIKILKENENTI